MTANPPNALALRLQTAVGAGIVLLGIVLAWGARGISSEAGYSGVGPNFMPLVVSVALMACGAWIVWESLTGGFRQMAVDEDAPAAFWPAFAWVSAGLLINAELIARIGFIFSCTICYVLAVQGMRRAANQGTPSPRVWLVDVATGLAITAPVFWLFTKFLAINLPGLTASGWL